MVRRLTGISEPLVNVSIPVPVTSKPAALESKDWGSAVMAIGPPCTRLFARGFARGCDAAVAFTEVGRMRSREREVFAANSLLF